MAWFCEGGQSNTAAPDNTTVCLFVILYIYPVAWGPKGHGSGGFLNMYALFLAPTG